MKPLSERVMDWAVARLAQIAIADGYETDAGANVSRARRTFGETELPALTVFEESEVPGNGQTSDETDSFTTRLGFAVFAHVVCDQADTGQRLGLMRADVKRALMRPDALGNAGVSDDDGQIGSLIYQGSTAAPREDGASIESVRVSFIAKYPETFGDPYRND
jgi:hypothetical protein